MSLPPPSISPERLAQCRETMLHRIPHMQALGVTLDALSVGSATLSLPWQEHLVGNTHTGFLHGGCVTALLDNACGMAVSTCFEEATPLVTLDLRVDYPRPAAQGMTLKAEAHVYCFTRSVIFVRGVAYDASNHSHPVANCVATFMPVEK